MELGDRSCPMGYDDMKEHDGERYTGMPVGGQHRWIYPDGRWRETKIAPEAWEITFESDKRRASPAPEGSGAAVGAKYHWFILAHQWVEKLDKDTYATRMEGRKHKIAHKRPYWRKWSIGYEDSRSERERLVEVLEQALARLVDEGDPGEVFRNVERRW